MALPPQPVRPFASKGELRRAASARRSSAGAGPLARALTVVFLPLVWGALTWGACSTDEPIASAAPASAEGGAAVFDVGPRHFGLVVLSLTEDRTSPRLSARVSASAWFVEHDQGRLQPVLTVLEPLSVAASTLREAQASKAVSDRCVLTVRQLGGRMSDQSGPIYFMDAGELALESDQGSLFFQSTYFPDVDPEVAGLVYDAAGPNARGLISSPTVRVTGSGASEVGPFVAELQPPAPLRLTRVGKHRFGARSSGISAGRHDGSNGPLSVEWLSAQPAGADAQPTVSVRYIRQGFDRVASVSCRVPDTGQYKVPAKALAALPDMGDDQTDRLEVARISVSGFEAEGLDQASAVFIARDSVLLR